VDIFERDFLVRLLTQYRGNVSHAAHAAGKERRELGKLLKKHQLDLKAFSAPPGEKPPPGG
jgi:DNA-binding NtrC family response regulator